MRRSGRWPRSGTASSPRSARRRRAADGRARRARLLVAGEGVGLEPAGFGAILEDGGGGGGGRARLAPALDQFDVGVVAQAEVVQPRGLGLGDVPGSGT